MNPSKHSPSAAFPGGADIETEYRSIEAALLESARGRWFLAEHGRYGIPFYVLYRPGAEPHVFSELLTQEAVLAAVRAARG